MKEYGKATGFEDGTQVLEKKNSESASHSQWN